MQQKKENAQNGNIFPFPAQRTIKELEKELFQLKEKSKHNQVINEVFITYLSTVPLQVELSESDYGNLMSAYYSSLQ